MQALGSKPALPLTQDGHHLYLLSPQKGDTTAGGLDQRLALSSPSSAQWTRDTGCVLPSQAASITSQHTQFPFPGEAWGQKAPRMRPESSRNFNLLLQQLTLNSALLLLT